VINLLNGRYLTTVVAEARFSQIDDVLADIREKLSALPCCTPKLIDAEICSPPTGISREEVKRLCEAGIPR
jgi:hypothetical protein